MEKENTNKRLFGLNQLDIAILGIVILTLSVYFQTRNFMFVYYDDETYVFNNPRLPEGFTWSNVVWAFKTLHFSNWHPLTWLSYFLDFTIYGLKPGGFHLTNVILHIINSLLVLFVLRGMSLGLWRSAFVSALFALHPMHVESVAWVAERKDLLFALFWLLAMRSYTGYARAPSIVGYLAVAAFFSMSLMSKPMAVTLPLVLLLLDFWPLGRLPALTGGGDVANQWVFQSKRVKPSLIFLEKLPLLVLSAISGVVTYYAQQKGNSSGYFNSLPLAKSIENAILSYVKYVGKLFYPVDMAMFYPVPKSFPPTTVALSLAFLLLASIFAIYIARRAPYVFTGWFWFTGTMVPAIGVVKVGLMAMADRYTYIPYVGLFIVIAFAVPEVLRNVRHKRAILTASAAVSIVLCTIVSARQTAYWENSYKLYHHAEDVTEPNVVTYCNLGFLYSLYDRDEGAVDYFKKALILDPGYINPYANLGTIYFKQNKFRESLYYFTKAVELNPKLGVLYYRVGRASMALGKYDEAVENFKKALALDPNDELASGQLRLALEKTGGNKQ